MCKLRAGIIGLALSFGGAGQLSGQYTATQDSTLEGLEQVFLNFQMTEGAVSPSLYQELASYLNLELRKTGVRVAREFDELASTDGLLNVSLLKTPRSLSNDFEVRIDVEQMATLQRTGQTLRMVTWYYEEAQLNVFPENVAKDMVTRGLNSFLNVWLDMNGR